MSKIKTYLLITVVLCFSAIFLISCSAPQEQDQISIIEVKQTQGEAVVKTLQADNCTGSEEMKQDMQAIHQYTHVIEINPNPGVSVNRRAVEDEIRSYYRIPRNESDAVCIVPVQIPAGSFYSYDLEWVEVWREGEFELGKADSGTEGTYRFRQSMLCEVVGQRTEACASQ